MAEGKQGKRKGENKYILKILISKNSMKDRNTTGTRGTRENTFTSSLSENIIWLNLVHFWFCLFVCF